MMLRSVAVVALFVLLAATRVHGHHSLTEYDSSRRITLNVVVRDFQFVNPHPYIVVDSPSTALEAGRGEPAAQTTQTWRLEMDNRFELVEIGMTARTFARGDQLLVSGAPGRDDKRILYVRELYRAADGFRYEQVGNTPQIIRAPFPGRQLK